MCWWTQTRRPLLQYKYSTSTVQYSTQRRDRCSLTICVDEYKHVVHSYSTSTVQYSTVQYTETRLTQLDDTCWWTQTRHPLLQYSTSTVHTVHRDEIDAAWNYVLMNTNTSSTPTVQYKYSTVHRDEIDSAWRYVLMNTNTSSTPTVQLQYKYSTYSTQRWDRCSLTIRVDEHKHVVHSYSTVYIT